MYGRNPPRPRYFIVAGVILVLLADLSVMRTLRWRASAATTVGHVTALRPEMHRVSTGKSSHKDELGYRTIVEYAGTDRSLRLVESRFVKSTPANTVGESINVFYQPTRPDKARIDDSDNLWARSTSLFLLAGGCFLLALLSFVQRRF